MFSLFFAPEQWLKVRLFRQFLGPPFPEHPELVKGSAAVENHLSKFQHLARLASRMRPTLSEDETELIESGYTQAHRSHEYAAVIETLFCELYACLDGVRRSIYGTYKKVRGVQNDSTEKLFARAFRNEYGPEFPEDIRVLMARAYETWFPELRRIRTEVTHGEVGYCHVDRDSGTVTYVHPALRQGDRALVIEKVADKLNVLSQQVVGLTEHLFGFWCDQLYPVERRVVCGIWNGRFYQRDVAPERDVTSASGRCYSVWWFRSSPEHACPLAASCPAFARRDEQVRQLAHTMWEQRDHPFGDDLADWYKAEELLSKAFMVD